MNEPKNIFICRETLKYPKGRLDISRFDCGCFVEGKETCTIDGRDCDEKEYVEKEKK